MMKRENQLIESLGFMTALTFVGGYIDAYTFVLRGGVFANNQTGNIAKLGIELANRNWSEALYALYPMLATVAGAFFAEHMKNRKYASGPSGWRQAVLIIELAVLFLAGFVPTTVPHVVVNLVFTFIAAWQLSMFRKFEGWIHNTTIATGNMRSVGQYWYQAWFMEKNPEFTRKTIRYALLVLSFCGGTLIGALFCFLLNIKAIWVACAVLVGVIVAHRSSLKQEAAQQ